MKLTTNKAPLHICKKASIVLEQFQTGRIRHKWYWRHKFYGLEVSSKWRLLSKDLGRSWELMSHEKYNGEIVKR